MNLDHNFYNLIDEIEDEELEHCFKHKLDKPHRFIAQYDLLKNFLNSSLEMKGNKPIEKSSIEGDGYKEKETSQASKTYEDIQLRNIISLIDKCKNNIDDGKDIPDEFKDITITSDEYNALLYARTKLKSLIWWDYARKRWKSNRIGSDTDFEH